MVTSTFNLLCEASQLSFDNVPAEEKESFIQRLDSLIEFSGIVKSIDCASDGAEDFGSVAFGDLREDIAVESFPTEKLLANTEPLFDCYVIPKIME